MNTFYDTSEYIKYLAAKEEMQSSGNALKRAFLPHLWFMGVKLAECYPCKYCDNMNYYHRGTNIEADCLDEEKCKGCLDALMWQSYCMSKLSHFESKQKQENGEVV